MGSPFNDHGGEDSGKVRVYEWRNDLWRTLGNEIIGESKGDLMGSAISFNANGTYLAIGAPFSDGNGKDSGQVRVYGLYDGHWLPLGNPIQGRKAGDLFGSTVKLNANGSRMAIGAPFSDCNGKDSGQVMVYGFRKGAWVQMGDDIQGDQEGDQAGISLGFNERGSMLIIGSPMHDGGKNCIGQVRACEWQNSKWSQMGESIVGKEARELLGSSVSISSNGMRMAIGAPLGSENGKKTNTGWVAVYAWKDGKWTMLGEKIHGKSKRGLFGNTVRLDSNGTQVAIGVPFGNGLKGKLGHVHIYELKNGNVWTQIRKIGGDSSGDLFGTSLSLSSDGKKLAMGSPFNETKGIRSGSVRIVQY